LVDPNQDVGLSGSTRQRGESTGQDEACTFAHRSSGFVDEFVTHHRRQTHHSVFGLQSREDLGLVLETLIHEQLEERARFGARQIVVGVIAIVHLTMGTLGGEPTVSGGADGDSDLRFGLAHCGRSRLRQ
jgi:hypothetical protein